MLRFLLETFNLAKHNCGIRDPCQLEELEHTIDMALNLDKLDGRVHLLLRPSTLLVAEVASLSDHVHYSFVDRRVHQSSATT